MLGPKDHGPEFIFSHITKAFRPQHSVARFTPEPIKQRLRCQAINRFETLKSRTTCLLDPRKCHRRPEGDTTGQEESQKQNRTPHHSGLLCAHLKPRLREQPQKAQPNLNSMPDPRSDWSFGWNDRRVVWFFANTNNERNPAHGWYAIFISRDTGYTPNRNINFKGEGNSVHKDVFIAKAVYQGKDKQGRTAYMDIPKAMTETVPLRACFEVRIGCGRCMFARWRFPMACNMKVRYALVI